MLGTIIVPFNGKNIVEYILQFGSLYLGTLRPDFFIAQYQERKKILLDIVSAGIDLDIWKKQNLGFNLYMTSIVRHQSWNYPGTITNNIINSGNSRLFASGLCLSDPWNTLKFMVLQTDLSVQMCLGKFDIISDFDDLNDILKISSQGTDYQCQIILEHYFNQERRLEARLRNIKYADEPDDHMTIGNYCLEKYLHWRQQHQTRPQIVVYTDWPELLKNTNDIWDIVEIKSVAEIRRLITKPGHIEREIYNSHHNKFYSVSDPEYRMHIIDPIPVDLSELIFYQTMDHNVYIDQNFKFILYRQDSCYNSTCNVSISHFEI